MREQKAAQNSLRSVGQQEHNGKRCQSQPPETTKKPKLENDMINELRFEAEQLQKKNHSLRAVAKSLRERIILESRTLRNNIDYGSRAIGDLHAKLRDKNEQLAEVFKDKSELDSKIKETMEEIVRETELIEKLQREIDLHKQNDQHVKRNQTLTRLLRVSTISSSSAGTTSSRTCQRHRAE